MQDKLALHLETKLIIMYPASCVQLNFGTNYACVEIVFHSCQNIYLSVTRIPHFSLLTVTLTGTAISIDSNFICSQ